jgi:hypothetical protein
MKTSYALCRFCVTTASEDILSEASEFYTNRGKKKGCTRSYTHGFALTHTVGLHTNFCGLILDAFGRTGKLVLDLASSQSWFRVSSRPMTVFLFFPRFCVLWNYDPLRWEQVYVVLQRLSTDFTAQVLLYILSIRAIEVTHFTFFAVSVPITFIIYPFLKLHEMNA